MVASRDKKKLKKSVAKTNVFSMEVDTAQLFLIALSQLVTLHLVPGKEGLRQGLS